MQHVESAIKVYYTKEYARFKTILGNRELNAAKIKRIKRDIEDGLDVLRYCPVLVTEKGSRLEIIDGQHRFYVAKQLGSAIWYIIAEELTLEQIAAINSNTEKWKDKDFINCFMQQGNKHYEVLQDFLDESKFPLSCSLVLLHKGLFTSEGGGTTGFKNAFRTGKFQVREKEKAYEVVKKVNLFADFNGHKTGAFIEAICRIIKSGKITVEEVHAKYKQNPKMLTLQRNGKEYLNSLEVIVNQNARTRKVIY